MKNKPDEKLLASYLSGECSSEENQEVKTWIQSDPKNQKFIKLMKKAWDSSEVKERKWDKQKLWQNITEKAGIETNNYGRRVIPFGKRIQFSHIWKIAAVLLFMVSISYIYFFVLNTSTQIAPEQVLQNIFVENGKQTKLTLPDGSVITLDAGTSFSYPEKFDENVREVFINGEGFFEVLPNPQKPFIVHANNTIIKVLGTKFNIRAWQQNQKVKVVVAEGKVSFNSARGKEEEKVIITEGQFSEIYLNEKPKTPKDIDVGQQLGWVNHEIIFKDIPLHEILFQMERWYDVKFNLSFSAIGEERLNIHIQNNSLDKLLEMISILTDLEYDQINKTINLHQK